MHDVSRDEFYRAIDGITAAINGVNAQLDRLNGRTRRVERSSYTQWVLWVILGSVGLALARHFGF